MNQITLYYTAGNSDKIYTAAINSAGDGFTVDFAYGRRGQSLKTGTKTKRPVSAEKAQAIYDKLVKEKMAKGYTPDTAGTVYSHSGKADQVSSVQCQLLNPAEEIEAERFIRDPVYCGQEKFDGERQLIQRSEDSVEAINRKGLYVGMADALKDSALSIDIASFIVDGEGMGDKNRAFDLLELNGEPLTHLAYRDRLNLLMEVLDISPQNNIVPVETAFTESEKRDLFNRVKAAGGEGIVFKRLDAPYTAGRPASGGGQIKIKFWASCSAVVDAQNDGKRSVSLTLLDGDTPVPVGNVTIPANADIPDPGDVIEVQYLYAYREGSLYQPVFLHKRTDIAPDECHIRQLKYKNEQKAA